ncbi:hypothetical protein [Methanosphaera cuniculi]|uniref:hypothetical protein n=1 Tax=Methanosphaera cuniculi TaxID=1077256 RepID=UPI0026ECD861|nr:hypothetical protein [Methanosphaera cuniculi]
MTLLDLIIQVSSIFISLLPLIVFLIFCSKNIIELVEDFTGIKLIENHMDYGNTILNNFLGFIPSSNYYVFVGGIYLICFLISCIFYNSILNKELFGFSVFLLPFFYAGFILSLRKNTFHPNGLPILTEFYLFKIYRMVYGIPRMDTDIDYTDKYYSYNSYLMISCVVGFIPTIGGVVSLFIGVIPILLLWGLFIQTLVLFPDKYDKILPLNFKKWSGAIFLLLLVIPSYIITFYISIKWGLYY